MKKILFGLLAPILFSSTACIAAGKPLSISLTPSTQTVTEGQSASFILNKAGGNGKPAPATVTTSDGSFSKSIPLGTSFTIPTKDDTLVNGTRTVSVKATATTNVTASASFNILDNDVAPPPPPPSPLIGENPIADNFPYANAVEPTWYGPAPTNRGGIPAPLPINEQAAFRLDTAPGPMLNIDPLVIPGKVNVSHLHQFWCNNGITENSNYLSLRTTGGTTCGLNDFPLNRSSYWAPAMMVGPGLAKKPRHIFIYYKRLAANSPACVGPAARGICVDLPNGIRYVTGWNSATNTGGPNDIRDYQWDFNFMGYDCYGSEDGTVPGVAGEYHTIKGVVDAGCPAGARLHETIDAPDCWDGRIDSPDHRSHVSYAKGDDLGYGRQCGPQYPYLIPGMSVQLFYDTDQAFVDGKWHLSSDEMYPGTIPGASLHMDYWEAWSPQAKTIWMTQCINKPASCSGGDLGNGTAIINGNAPYPQGFPEQLPVPAVAIPGAMPMAMAPGERG